MSQVAAKKRLVLKDEQVKVTAHFREQGSVLRGTSKGTCESFDIEMSIEADETTEEITELIRLAHRMCFTEAALAGEVKLNTQHLFNGKPIEVDTE